MLFKRNDDIANFHAEISLEIKNNSNENKILILNQIEIVGSKIETVDKKLIDTYSLIGSSFLPLLDDLKKNYPRQSPPKELTKVLEPGQSITINRSLSLSFSSLRFNSSPQDSFEHLKGSSDVFLTVTIKTGGNYLRRKNDTRSSHDFWLERQKDWEKYGRIVLDVIESEPIPFNINTVTIEEQQVGS